MCGISVAFEVFILRTVFLSAHIFLDPRVEAF
jgi:hypothetical protein